MWYHPTSQAAERKYTTLNEYPSLIKCLLHTYTIFQMSIDFVAMRKIQRDIMVFQVAK